MPRAALYLRVSSQGQADRELPIAGQERECRAYCERAGFTVDRVYRDEALSGRHDDRPGFQEMIRAAKSKEFDTIVTWELSRLSRKSEHTLAYVGRLRSWGVDVRSVTQDFLADTAMGRLMLTIMAGIAEFESEMIGERTQRGMAESAKRGRRPGGTPPYGYRSEDAHLIPVPSEADVIRLAVGLRLKDGLGIKAIANALNERGYRTRKGKMWTGERVHHVLTSHAVRGHLLTRLYHTDPPEEVLMEGAHEAVITEEEFRRLGLSRQQPDYTRAKRAKSKGREMPRSRKIVHPLTGLLECAVCGNTYHARGGRGRGGKYYHSYACSKCPKSRRVSAADEARIVKAVLDATMSPEAIDEALTWWRQQGDARLKELEGSVAAARRRRDAISAHIDRLVDAVAEGADAKPLNARLTALHKELLASEEDVNRALAELDVADADVLVDEESWSAWMAVIRRALEEDSVMAGSFVRSVVNRIEVPVEGPYVVHHTLLKPAQCSERLESQTPTDIANHGGSNDNPIFMHWLRD